MSESVQAWRLVKRSRAESAFDGEGAFRYGGRWNSRGHRAVYASGSLALALLEILVHVDPAGPLPELLAFPIQLPMPLIEPGPPSELKHLGERLPWHIGTTRRIGDTWIQAGRMPALRVPSSVVPIEHNYLLNPEHREFHRIRIGQPEPFLFDPRLRNG